MARTITPLGAGAGLVLVALLTPMPAGANTVDKLTYLTFSGPVHVPGALLDPGTYRFRLTNPETSRNVVQVLSDNGKVVYAMFHTIPDRRTELTEQSMVTFKETPAGTPSVARSLFYGGEYDGYEFVYGAMPPLAYLPEPRQPEVTYTALPPVVMPAAVVPAEPEREPMTVRAADVPYAEVAAPVQGELPRTASPLPWVAAGGLISVLLGLALGLANRRV